MQNSRFILFRGYYYLPDRSELTRRFSNTGLVKFKIVRFRCKKKKKEMRANVGKISPYERRARKHSKLKKELNIKCVVRAGEKLLGMSKLRGSV